MSFYIRKSVKFGPIRFNISKSGIGISSGVRGARISTGPRGTYINLGTNGVYYRKKINEAISTTNQTSKPNDFEKNTTFDGEIPTASVNELLESTNLELITQINTRIKQPTYALLVGALSVIVASVCAYLSLSLLSNLVVVKFLILLAAFIIGALGLYLAWVTNQQEKLARTTTLKYNLDEEAKKEFVDLQNALTEISRSIRIWQVTSKKANWDWKRNAGASSLITRGRITVGQSKPPFLQTSIKTHAFSVSSMKLFFLPDQIFVFQNNKYGAVPYILLEAISYPTRYIEDDPVPSDSKILDYTWQYVRKDGGPDRRFSNNRQIPIVEYGQIELSSQNGMNLHFQVSNLLLAQEFGRVLSRYIHFYKNSPQSSSKRATSSKQEEKTEPRQNNKSQGSNAYTLLNVSSNASQEEITSSYKRLAQQYHPDKVAGLAPELQELAESRMKEINAAYKELMTKLKE